MKQIKDIKNKIEWEKYYDPDFDWSNYAFYRNNKLSEDFIREFKDKVDWEHISYYQKLSEDFIREFKDRVDWMMISRYKTLSEEFVKEFKEEFKKELHNL